MSAELEMVPIHNTVKDIHVVIPADPAREQLSALASELLERRDEIRSGAGECHVAPVHTYHRRLFSHARCYHATPRRVDREGQAVRADRRERRRGQGPAKAAARKARDYVAVVLVR